MPEPVDPRDYRTFLGYYSARFAARYVEATKPRTRRDQAADIAEAEREYQAAWGGEDDAA